MLESDKGLLDTRMQTSEHTCEGLPRLRGDSENVCGTILVMWTETGRPSPRQGLLSCRKVERGDRALECMHLFLRSSDCGHNVNICFKFPISLLSCRDGLWLELWAQINPLSLKNPSDKGHDQSGKDLQVCGRRCRFGGVAVWGLRSLTAGERLSLSCTRHGWWLL